MLIIMYYDILEFNEFYYLDDRPKRDIELEVIKYLESHHLPVLKFLWRKCKHLLENEEDVKSIHHLSPKKDYVRILLKTGYFTRRMDKVNNNYLFWDDISQTQWTEMVLYMKIKYPSLQDVPFQTRNQMLLLKFHTVETLSLREEKCPICLNDLLNTDAIETNCEHQYCSKCIKILIVNRTPLSASHIQCVYCRGDIIQLKSMNRDILNKIKYQICNITIANLFWFYLIMFVDFIFQYL